MQITDLYQTKITCHSDEACTTEAYNVNIDGTAYIKVKLIDFNGAAVTSKSVTITSEKGSFTKYKDNSHTSWTNVSNAKSLTATTNSSGEILITWTASEWGLCTFSANNNNTQVNVKGYKLYNTVNSNDLTIKEYTDGIRVTYAITGSTTIQQGVLTNKVSLKPVADITIELNPSKGNDGARLRIAVDGGMQFVKNANTSDSCVAQSSATTFLANLLY